MEIEILDVKAPGRKPHKHDHKQLHSKLAEESGSTRHDLWSDDDDFFIFILLSGESDRGAI